MAAWEFKFFYICNFHYCIGMRLLSISISLVFMLFLLPDDISGGNRGITGLRTSESGSGYPVSYEFSDIRTENLQLDLDDTRPSNSGEQADTSIIPIPVLNYSKYWQPDFYGLQIFVVSKKSSSLIAHNNRFCSTNLRFSPLVNILRI
jgi:hypothetical protein